MILDYSKEKLEKYKWPISVSRKIKSSPVSIWKAISKPGNLEDCHPFCDKNPVHEWPGVGAKDTIYYYSSRVMHREFVSWIEGIGYDLVIGSEGERKSFVSWRITEKADHLSTLNITIYPHLTQTIPIPLRWILYKVYIQPRLRSYLESVVKGFEWFITTEKPVTRNQFGAHNWFSNRRP